MRKSRQLKTLANRKAAPAPARGLAAASAAMEEVARLEVIEVPTSGAKSKKSKPKTRDGKKGLVLYVPPEVTLALRKLALQNNSDVQRMGWRALELLFAECNAHLPSSTPPTSKA